MRLSHIVSICLALVIPAIGSAYERVRCPDELPQLKRMCKVTIPDKLKSAYQEHERWKSLAWRGDTLFVPMKCRRRGIENLESCRDVYAREGGYRSASAGRLLPFQQLVIDPDLNVLFAVINAHDLYDHLADDPGRFNEYQNEKHPKVAESVLYRTEDEIYRWEDAYTSCCEFKLDQMLQKESNRSGAGYPSLDPSVSSSGFDPSIRPPNCSLRPTTREWTDQRNRGQLTQEEQRCRDWRDWALKNQPDLYRR